MDERTYKAYDEMNDWEREVAIHSARYILEDVSMDEIMKASGLPMGVIVAAWKNIFCDINDDFEFTPNKKPRPILIKN